MQIVKTKGHLIYSAHAGAPDFACLGQCRKVWWRGDLDAAVVEAPVCPQCKGTLTSKIPEGHYVVAVADAGPLEVNGSKVTNAGLNLGK
ncbi:TPA: hypothetical protein ACPJC0_006299 [Pseudomonas aeruginosa]